MMNPMQNQSSNIFARFLNWRAKVRYERENLFNDWLLNDDLQERWRLRVLAMLSLIFLFFAFINTSIGLKVYLNNPNRQNWQFLILLIGAILWIALMIFIRYATRTGKSSYIAIYLMLIAFFIGPTGLSNIGIEDFSRFYNSSLILTSIIFISILSPRRNQYVLISISIVAWFAMLILQFIFYKNSITTPVPELLDGMAPGVITSSILFYLILIMQFYRLPMPSKILLSIMTAMQVIYLIILGYSGQILAEYLPQMEILNYLRELQFILEFTLGGIALAILIITRVISMPLTRLTDVALQVKEGNLSVQVPISSIDEIGELSKVFNQTTDKLEETLNGLEKTVVARTHDLEIAFAVSKQITQVLRLDELLPQLVENTRKGFDLYFVSVYLYDRENRQLMLSAGTGEAGRQMKEECKCYHIEARPSIVAQAARDGQAIVIEDTSVSHAHFQNPLLPDTRSEAAIPMLVQGELVGILGVQSKEINDFHDTELRILTSLAEQIGVAVKNARLYEEQLLTANELKRVFNETQRLLKETEQRNAELAIINSVQAGLVVRLDIQGIYNLVGDNIVEVTGSEIVLIDIWDSETEIRRFVYNWEKGKRFPDREHIFTPLEKQIFSDLQNGKTIVWNEGMKERIMQLGHSHTVVGEMPLSVIFVPLKTGNTKQVTTIALQNSSREYAFSKSDIRFIETLANSMSVAIQNVRLFTEAKEALAKAEEASQAKSAFLSSMSHELRTPLNAIINFVEMIARGMIGPVNQEQKELLDQALNSSKHLLHLINDVLDISKIQAGRLTLFIEDQVNLYEELEAVLDMVDGLAREKRLQLVKDIDPNLPLISCDRRRVRQILLNLMSNAIKFTEQGTVTLSAKNHGNEVLFAVIDTGPGISPAEQQGIFEPFIQTEDGAKQMQGTGLGLSISHSLVQIHGGKLWLESQIGEGASFFFSLPVIGRSLHG